MSATRPTASATATASVGMTVFLGAWTMTFAALLFVWADVRWTAGAWPPDGEPRAPLAYPAFATLLMAASSWALARRRVTLTALLGVAFVAVQAAGWAALWRLGVTPSSGRYGSLVYTFGAFHALHVLTGLVGLLAARTSRSWRRFWHFVGAVWLCLFAVLYLAGCADGRALPAGMVLPGGRVVDGRTLARGRAAYQQYCRPCHGEFGDGRGASAIGLRPPPRDFTPALFKFGHVPAGALPPDDELRAIVHSGLEGTAMRPWDLSSDELDGVIQYLKLFSPRWLAEAAAPAIEASPDPFGAAHATEAVALGAEVYHKKAQCSSCHPEYVGRATKRPALLRQTDYCLEWKPGWKRLDERECALPVKVLPPDFTRDPLRTVHAGSELPDLYRVIAAGIGGSGMPTWKGALDEDELWALAYYVRSLRPTAALVTR
jgi:heme/copper-type cytochrome/quinol oxidase subunit 3/mono/diheme cytochrome c family protein